MGSNKLKCVVFFESKSLLPELLLRVLGCLLALKRLCERLLEMGDYFNNHLIPCFFKVSNFLTVFYPYARHKSPTNITPSFSIEL